MRGRNTQQGLTLVEVLVALAITAALLAPLASLFQSAAGSGAAVRAGLDLNADARFALDRVAARIGAMTAVAIDAPLDDATPLLKLPSMNNPELQKISYALSGTDLVETDTSTNPARASVIASNVAAWRLAALATGDGQPVFRIELTLANAGGTVSAARTVRVGSPL